MKVGFLKSALSLFVASALVFGEAGAVLAAEPVEMQISAEEMADAEALVEILDEAETETISGGDIFVEEPEAEEIPGEEALQPEETESEEISATQATEDPETTEAMEVTESSEETAAKEEEEQLETPIQENQEQEEKAQQPQEETVNSEPQAAAGTASIQTAKGFAEDGSYRIDVAGKASKVVIKINGVTWRTDQNYYGGATENTEPNYDGRFYFYDNMIPGATYKFEITPYNSEDNKGTPKTLTYKAPAIKFRSVESHVYGMRAETNGNTTGYRKPYVYLYANVENYGGRSVTYKIYRAEKKKTAAYKEIGKVEGYSYLSYKDEKVGPGTKYFYKIKPVLKTDEYVKTAPATSFSQVTEAASELTAECGVSYENGSVTLVMTSYDEYASGFDVFRSAKKGSGYKKIATISDTEYTDKNVKGGQTYYYKVKPFYYDVTSGKKYPGSFSEPTGVRLLIGSMELEVAQTGAHKAKLTWTKASGAKSYEIFYKTKLAGDAYKRLAVTNKTSYTAGKLSADGYYFQIRATQKAGDVKSYYQSYSISLDMGLTSPRNLRIVKRTASVKGNTATIQTKLKWDRVYGAKSYRIEGYSNKDYSWKTLKKISNPATTTYTLRNTVTKGSSAKYDGARVVAVKGEKEYGSTIYGLSVLNSASGVKVKRASATSAKVTWKKPAGADVCTVYRMAPTGGNVYLGEVKGASFVDKTLTPGVNYTYSISARNSKIGISSSSYGYDDEPINQAVYKHKLGGTAITSVKNPSAKKAAITWKKAAYAKSYIIYRAESKKGAYKKIGEAKGKTSYTDTKAAKGKTYYYKVAAKTINDAGITVISGMSSVKSVKIKK